MKKLLVLPLVALLAACSGGAKSSSLSLSARAGSVAASLSAIWSSARATAASAPRSPSGPWSSTSEPPT